MQLINGLDSKGATPSIPTPAARPIKTTYVLPGPRFFIAFFLHLKFIDLDQWSTGGLGLDFQDIPLREIATIKSKASTNVFVKQWLIVGDWRRLKMLTKP